MRHGHGDVRECGDVRQQVCFLLRRLRGEAFKHLRGKKHAGGLALVIRERGKVNYIL
jgi:hypothetical protein